MAESGAQKNVKPDWNAASGSAAEILNKPAAVQPATVAPLMDGTAAVGSSAKYAKEDHVHPSDTSKADKATTLAGYGITNAYTKAEVDAAISNALKGGYVVANPLPTASADTTVPVPDVLLPALEWLIAARAFGSRGDANHSAICQQNAQNLLT